MITLDDFDPDEFHPGDIDGPTLKLYGKLSVDCTRDELVQLMEFFEDLAAKAERDAAALAAEKQRRFGADIIQFPGGVQ